MIVYGDPQRAEDPRSLIAKLSADCLRLHYTRGVEQRELATRLLIEAGELAQGLLDHEFQRVGYDEWTPLARSCAALILPLGRLQTDSATSLAPALSALAELNEQQLPISITVKVPEGFAFYALYPEQYALAAQHCLAGHSDSVAVIGLRSIGVSLAAVVAAAINATAPIVTLRPAGHPFQRKICIGPKLESILLSADRFAIVDEGPGLSGSSFGAVADWLEGRGVRRERIIFFPGHAGPLGPRAAPEHRQRWEQCRKSVVEFEELLRGLPSRRDRRAELDVQISLMAEHEITRLIQMVDRIARHLHVELDAEQELEQLKQDVQAKAVLQEIERTEHEAAAADGIRAERS
jgi:hypothetical protein